MVANAIELVNTKLTEYKLPSSTAFEAAVNSGILVSKGLNYYNLGKQTAEQAKKILVDKTAIAEIPVETSTNAEVLINKNCGDFRIRSDEGAVCRREDRRIAPLTTPERLTFRSE